MALNKPTVFDYMNINLYLQDFYQFQKSIDSQFSYEFWSRQLGFSNKTLLRMIVMGKRRLTSDSKEKFYRVLDLNSLEKEYFDALTDYCQAQTAKQRQAMGTRLIQVQRMTFVQTEYTADSGILKSVYGPIIMTILCSAENGISSFELATLLNVEKSQIMTVLTELESMGAAVKTSDVYKANQSSFKVPELFNNQNLKDFYKFWIGKSITAIDLPVEIRRFRSLQIPLSQDEFDEVVKTINDFAMTLLSRFDKNTIDSRKLYLINSAIFPV